MSSRTKERTRISTDSHGFHARSVEIGENARPQEALFKSLLKTPAILQGFFETFVPMAAPSVDFGTLEFVDKERITAEGRKRTGGLLVKTRFRGKNARFLIHLEHQAQPDPDLARRMLDYFLLD